MGTFKSECRPARKRVNPRTGQLRFTPEQVRLTFELSRRLNKVGKPKASKLGLGGGGIASGSQFDFDHRVEVGGLTHQQPRIPEEEHLRIQRVRLQGPGPMRKVAADCVPERRQEPPAIRCTST